MEDVLWHSATFFASKSILVKMPRLPTIRVIGSQFISTRFFDLLGTSFVGAVIVLIVIAPYDLSALSKILSRILVSRTGGDIRSLAPRANGATWALCSASFGKLSAAL